MWLFVAFILIPLVEIGLFIQVGGAIGLWPTLAIVVLTAIAGSWLVRSQGMATMGNLQNSFRDLQDPTEPLAHGAMILFAGALLLTPGFFTDMVGFLLLIPGVRSAITAQIKNRMKTSHFSMGQAPGSTAQKPAEDIIETEYSDISGEPKPTKWSRD